MSYTNHTANYNLPQWIATDKPSYLGDQNTAFGAIDTQMKANADAAALAKSTADGAQEDAATALANAATAQSAATTAQSTANTAATNANAALADLAKFDLDTEINLTVTSNFGTVTANTLKIRKDSTNSIYKFYGQLTVTNLTSITGNLQLTVTTDSGLDPEEEYNIENALLVVFNSNTYGALGIDGKQLTVKTDGTLVIPEIEVTSSVDVVKIIANPNLYFNTNFGD